MSDPVSDLKRELLAAAERQQAHAVPARRNLRRWLLRSDVQQGRRGRHLVALFAALVVAVGAASAIGSVRDFILDRGFVGLPPEGATPSTPESGELVLRWLGRSETLGGRPLVRVWVYADGRIIWSRSGRIPEGASELTSGYLEQRLTPQGVELLRSEVLELLEASRTPLETVPTDDDPRGGTFGVEVRDGDRLVRLREQSEGTSALPEQLSARRRIDALLTDPASVLPSSAWAVREVRAYVPSHYAVCIDTAPPKDASHLLSLLPPRAADLLRYKRRTSSEADVLSNIDQVPGHMVVIGRSVTHCSKLTTEEAREVAKALSGLDPDPRFHTVVLAYLVAEGVHDWERTAIWFEPYFPHGQFTRSDSG